ncbi:rop guanine nucleotide exchange factor 12-like isoform X1 [Iris pallida]|uniref:Rop guanine nucleotide exchange factor 12-like isoform X1 n=1 Tax=Iris pallida TaxID=29817 RepID=A0AAX6EQ17_IRIPA|nr:rop guanine nucleotide exchange factor 12-like isoform X1 [Iris pallida]KAJ6806166.1 rop guanine nucleotide exchange factor 12-like isoform X1 [Iris pallida]KAJ6809760.1 rop guanine nucleotide exchange factor 12-like isoform X1 [Iris pallida]KAJ6841097.1 rop guanine nucleotide exchange factor 12-like isoform X1 [Iris pallida]
MVIFSHSTDPIWAIFILGSLSTPILIHLHCNRLFWFLQVCLTFYGLVLGISCRLGLSGDCAAETVVGLNKNCYLA